MSDWSEWGENAMECMPHSNGLGAGGGGCEVDNHIVAGGMKDSIHMELNSLTAYSDETADSLFETFFTTKERGMGMGVAISRSIINIALRRPARLSK